jgi:hypothetical protein
MSTAPAVITYDESGKPVQTEGKFACVACTKTFTTNGSLKRHHERSPVCVTWISNSKSMAPHMVSFYAHMTEKITMAMTGDGVSCKYCGARFSTSGNLHRHFSTSNIVCNRMAFESFQRFALPKID